QLKIFEHRYVTDFWGDAREVAEMGCKEFKFYKNATNENIIRESVESGRDFSKHFKVSAQDLKI
ncbi:1755_t:CDS:1, partial [Gigaspora margarita]